MQVIFSPPSFFFFFSSRRRHTRWTGDWSSDVCFPIYRERTRKTSAMNLNGSFMPAFYSTVERERFILEGCAPHLTSAYPKNKGAGREARRLSAMRSEERRVGKECRAWWRREREVDREE